MRWHRTWLSLVLPLVLVPAGSSGADPGPASRPASRPVPRPASRPVPRPASQPAGAGGGPVTAPPLLRELFQQGRVFRYRTTAEARWPGYDLARCVVRGVRRVGEALASELVCTSPSAEDADVKPFLGPRVFALDRRGLWIVPGALARLDAEKLRRALRGVPRFPLRPQQARGEAQPDEHGLRGIQYYFYRDVAVRIVVGGRIVPCWCRKTWLEWSNQADTYWQLCFAAGHGMVRDLSLGWPRGDGGLVLLGAGR